MAIYYGSANGLIGLDSSTTTPHSGNGITPVTAPTGKNPLLIPNPMAYNYAYGGAHFRAIAGRKASRTQHRLPPAARASAAMAALTWSSELLPTTATPTAGASDPSTSIMAAPTGFKSLLTRTTR